MSFEIVEADQYIWGDGFRILRVVAALGSVATIRSSNDLAASKSLQAALTPSTSLRENKWNKT
jgi:hypothetical protein